MKKLKKFLKKSPKKKNDNSTEKYYIRGYHAPVKEQFVASRRSSSSSDSTYSIDGFQDALASPNLIEKDKRFDLPSEINSNDLRRRYSLDSVSDIELISFPTLPSPEQGIPLQVKIMRSIANGDEHAFQTEDPWNNRISTALFSSPGFERINGHEGYKLKDGNVRKILPITEHAQEEDIPTSIQKPADWNLFNNNALFDNYEINAAEENAEVGANRQSYINEYYFYSTLQRQIPTRLEAHNIGIPIFSTLDRKPDVTEPMQDTQGFVPIIEDSNDVLPGIISERAGAVNQINDVLNDVGLFLRDLESENQTSEVDPNQKEAILIEKSASDFSDNSIRSSERKKDSWKFNKKTLSIISSSSKRNTQTENLAFSVESFIYPESKPVVNMSLQNGGSNVPTEVSAISLSEENAPKTDAERLQEKLRMRMLKHQEESASKKLGIKTPPNSINFTPYSSSTCLSQNSTLNEPFETSSERNHEPHYSITPENQNKSIARFDSSPSMQNPLEAWANSSEITRLRNVPFPETENSKTETNQRNMVMELCALNNEYLEEIESKIRSKESSPVKKQESASDHENIMKELWALAKDNVENDIKHSFDEPIEECSANKFHDINPPNDDPILSREDKLYNDSFQYPTNGYKFAEPPNFSSLIVDSGVIPASVVPSKLIPAFSSNNIPRGSETSATSMASTIVDAFSGTEILKERNVINQYSFEKIVQERYTQFHKKERFMTPLDLYSPRRQSTQNDKLREMLTYHDYRSRSEVSSGWKSQDSLRPTSLKNKSSTNSFLSTPSKSKSVENVENTKSVKFTRSLVSFHDEMQDSFGNQKYPTEDVREKKIYRNAPIINEQEEKIIMSGCNNSTSLHMKKVDNKMNYWKKLKHSLHLGNLFKNCIEKEPRDKLKNSKRRFSLIPVNTSREDLSDILSSNRAQSSMNLRITEEQNMSKSEIGHYNSERKYRSSTNSDVSEKKKKGFFSNLNTSVTSLFPKIKSKEKYKHNYEAGALFDHATAPVDVSSLLIDNSNNTFGQRGNI